MAPSSTADEPSEAHDIASLDSSLLTESNFQDGDWELEPGASREWDMGEGALCDAGLGGGCGPSGGVPTTRRPDPPRRCTRTRPTPSRNPILSPPTGASSTTFANNEDSGRSGVDAERHNLVPHGVIGAEYLTMKKKSGMASKEMLQRDP